MEISLKPKWAQLTEIDFFKKQWKKCTLYDLWHT